MSTIEDRLSAALSARADLVQPEDLRAPAPPAANVVPLVRRPSTWAVAAAAAAVVAAVVVVPLVVDGDDSAPQPAPAPTPAVPNGDRVPGADWRVAYTYPQAYDVDGDGAPDRLVIRTEGDEELPAGVRRFEAHLSTGGVAAVLLDYDTYDLTAIEPVDLDADGSDEIFYYRGSAGPEELGVLDLVDGALVDLAVPLEPGLTSEPDEGFHARGWFVDDGELYSWRTVDGGFVPGGTNPTKPPYEVDLFHWVLVDGELTAEPEGTRCWDGGDGAASLQPC